MSYAVDALDQDLNDKLDDNGWRTGRPSIESAIAMVQRFLDVTRSDADGHVYAVQGETDIAEIIAE